MFVRGGNVNPGDYLDYAGDAGNYWSSVGYTRTTAPGTTVSLSAVSPSAAKHILYIV